MEQLYFTILYAILAIFIIRVVKMFYDAGTVAPNTELYFQDTSMFVQKIVSRCKTLKKCYVPTSFWGKSGHIQSAVLSIAGRFGRTPSNRSTRHVVTAKDGSTISYDLFKAICAEDNKSPNELIVCIPGICNHAETDYIKAFAYNMNQKNYDVAVFNHTGSLKDIKLTKPRLFTYGHTQDLDVVVKTLYEKEKRKMIAVGFSLGGNILMKYLGESEDNQKMFHFAICVCQGYDVTECCNLMQDWDNMRCVYNYSLTRNMLKIIKYHRESFDRHLETKEPPVKLNWRRIQSARYLHELDTEFSMKVYDEKKLFDWYRDCSSSQYMEKIHIPMLILNAKDDPLIPECLFKYPKQLVDNNKYALFVVPSYGGHLGFFEGGYFVPNSVSWLDRLLVDYCDVTLNVMKEENLYEAVS